MSEIVGGPSLFVAAPARPKLLEFPCSRQVLQNVSPQACTARVVTALTAATTSRTPSSAKRRWNPRLNGILTLFGRKSPRALERKRTLKASEDTTR